MRRKMGHCHSLDEFRQVLERIIAQGHVIGMGVVLLFSDGEGRTYQYGLDEDDLVQAGQAFASWPKGEWVH